MHTWQAQYLDRATRYFIESCKRMHTTVALSKVRVPTLAVACSLAVAGTIVSPLFEMPLRSATVW